jgi:hypothetical protein
MGIPAGFTSFCVLPAIAPSVQPALSVPTGTKESGIAREQEFPNFSSTRPGYSLLG